MTHRKGRIVIVGGGTAGWLTAAMLASRPGFRRGWSVTLVESAQVPAIGVGEGSFPTLRSTLAALGRSEGAFLRAADATFKQGVHFTGWGNGNPGAGAGGDDYIHPFNLPLGGDSPGLLPFWLDTEADPARPAYADAVGVQAHVIRAARGPKQTGDADFAGPMNYAYHFDAAKLGHWLREVAQDAGVARIETTIAGATQAADGRVEALVRTDGGPPIAGDLFIDCSGFAARLIGAALGEPLRSVRDVLFNDRALCLQVPLRDDAAIPAATLAAAHSGGWTWDIALAHRRGVGCVFSSRHMDEDGAAGVLRAHLGDAAGNLAQARLLSFEPGYRARPWIGNVVAIGLAGGFVEPLEATGIMLVELAARMVADLLPESPAPDTARDAPTDFTAASCRFNRHMAARYEGVIAFLKLHYALSRRTDSAYWRDNTDPASWPRDLAERLAEWRHRLPSRFDFVADHETFHPPSWDYIAHGMGFRTRAGRGAISADPGAAADARTAFSRIRAAAPQAVSALPDHRALIAHYRQMA